MLSGLGTAVLATCVRSRTAWLALAAGFATTAAWTIQSGRLPDASWIGCVVALIAAWQLVRPDSAVAATVAAAGAGALAAIWGSVLQLEAIPRVAALLIGAGTMISTAWLANHRRSFAPPALREEGLLIILAMGVIVGTAPTVAQGWRSAVALNITDTAAAPGQVVSGWTLAFIGASVALGGLWSMWRRG
jgi:hypothetical protein